MDLNSVKNRVLNTFETVQQNKPVYYGLLFLVFIAVLIMLYRQYKSLVNKERMEPVFIRNVKSADQMVQITDELIPTPVGGAGFTYSVWIFVNNYSKNSGSYRHVFHKGDVNFKSCSPAVWMIPNTNSLAILLDTSDRAKGSENVVEQKGKVPQNYNTLGSKDQKLANQTACTCKGFLTVDESAKQAVYLNDTKECIIYNADRDLEMNDIATTWTKRNLNVETMDPRVNKEIIQDDSNCVIVENIPLQRWFHLVMVANETSMEVYVDGKLYKTIVLRSLPRTNGNPLYVNLDGGYDGMINELRYYPYPLRYIDVYNMYARGPTPFYFMYLFKGKLELYEEKFNQSKMNAKDYLKDLADDIYGY